jgi:hypothetical protein
MGGEMYFISTPFLEFIMNYNFDDFTVIQLVHLVRDQTLYADKIKFEEGICTIPFHRNDEPNKGEYNLVMKNVISCSMNFEKDVSEDVFEEIEYDKDKKTILIKSTKGCVLVQSSDIDVSAVGT